ncbi:hypothetical protein BASA83_012624 [Batrachochytrium salamandrivorans]|nr:hypothetical protein BASA83_012624 [Batrachochytrium salamandrivorans]
MQFIHLFSFVILPTCIKLLQRVGYFSVTENDETILKDRLETILKDRFGDNSEGSAGDNSEGSTGDNSEGSTGDNSGSDSSPPPATTLENTVSVPFTDKDVTSMNLAFYDQQR